MSGNCSNGLLGLTTGIQLLAKNQKQNGLVRTDISTAGNGNYGNFVDTATYPADQRIAGYPGLKMTSQSAQPLGSESFRMAPTSQSSGLPLAKIPLAQ